MRKSVQTAIFTLFVLAVVALIIQFDVIQQFTASSTKEKGKKETTTKLPVAMHN